MDRFTIDSGEPADPSHTGEAVLAAAERFKGKDYVLWGRLDLSDRSHETPWDCSELCSWSLYHTTGILFGAEPAQPLHKANAYTKLWGQQAEARGCAIPVEDALRIPGAYLLRKPRWFVGGHIALSDGRGGTMEARSRDWGVGGWDDAAARSWDIGILVPGVSYVRMGEEPALSPPDLVMGDAPADPDGVAAIQARLKELTFYHGIVDGDFGPLTEMAVTMFQHDQGVVADGQVGGETLAKLRPCDGAAS